MIKDIADREEHMKKLAKKLACAVLAGTMGLSMLAGCGSDKIDGTKPLITGGDVYKRQVYGRRKDVCQGL